MGTLNLTHTPKEGLQVSFHGSITLVPCSLRALVTHTTETHNGSALKCQAASRTQSTYPERIQALTPV